jgi:predicted nucleic acid-binding protein
MNADRAFFDTNILVYAFSDGDSRQDAALGLLLSGGTVSVPCLNEFVNITVNKVKKPWADVMSRLDIVRQLCEPPIPLTATIHDRAVQIAQAAGYHIYDALMLASALEARCTIFYTEDLHHGHKLGDLTIRNPFRQKV